MSKITPYDPGSIASPLVGVAPRNPKGEAMRQYARDIAGTRDQLNQLATAQAEGIKQGFYTGASAFYVTKSLANGLLNKTKNTHNNALAQIQSQKDQTQFGDDLAAKAVQFKQLYPNDPITQQKEYGSYVDNTLAQYKDLYPSYDTRKNILGLSFGNNAYSDPDNIAQHNAGLEHVASQHLTAFDNYASDEATKQAHAVGGEALNNSLHVLASSNSTDLKVLKTNLTSVKGSVLAAIDNPTNREHLGDNFVKSEAVDKLDKISQAGYMQMHNAVSGLTPDMRLSALKNVQEQIAVDPDLLPHSKTELINQNKAAVNDAQTQMGQQIESGLSETDTQALSLKMRADDINPKISSTGFSDLNGLKTETQTAITDLDKKIASIPKNLDDKHRNELMAAYQSRKATLTGVYGVIDTKIHTTQNEALAETNKLNKDDLNTTKQNKIVEIGNKQQALLVQTNPELAAKQRIDLAQTVNNAYKEGLITATQRNSYITADLKGQLSSDHYMAQSKAIGAVSSVLNAVNTNPGKNGTQVHQAAIEAEATVRQEMASGTLKPDQAENYIQRINALETHAALIQVPKWKLPWAPDNPQELKGSKAIVASAAAIKQEVQTNHALQIITGLNNNAQLTPEQDLQVQKKIMPYIGSLTDEQLKMLVGSTQALVKKGTPEGTSVYDKIIQSAPVRTPSGNKLSIPPAPNTPSILPKMQSLKPHTRYVTTTGQYGEPGTLIEQPAEAAENYPIGKKVPYPSATGYEGVTTGNINSEDHPLIDFRGGLTDKNSTAAARKENKFKGDVGSEWLTQITVGNKAVSIPVIYDGKVHSLDEAKKRYENTHIFYAEAPIAKRDELGRYETASHLRYGID